MPKTITPYIILADDDEDDCFFFTEALNKIMNPPRLIIFNNGVSLIKHLEEEPVPPRNIFLDINMRQKNGIQCLTEIRSKKAYDTIPIVMFSTSSNMVFIEQTYKKGANLYITKPGSAYQIERIIQYVLSINWSEYVPNPPKPTFSKYILKLKS